jgi:ribosomal protein S14
MKYIIQKDKNKRVFYYKKEFLKNILSNITKNKKLYHSFRWKALTILSLVDKKHSKTMFVNRCVITGRQKGILTKFKLSRISFLQMCRSNKVFGIKNFFS